MNLWKFERFKGHLSDLTNRYSKRKDKVRLEIEFGAYRCWMFQDYVLEARYVTF